MKQYLDFFPILSFNPGTTYQSITFRFKENFLQYATAFKLKYLSVALDGTSPLVLHHNEYIIRNIIF